MTVGSITGYTGNFRFILIAPNAHGWSDLDHQNLQSLDSILLAISGASGVLGTWANGTVYSAGDRVVDPDDGSIWQVAVAHTSAAAGTFSADRTANPTYWTSLINAPSYRGVWTTATNYNVNEFVLDSVGNRYAVANTTHTSGATFAGDIANWDVVIDLSNLGDIVADSAQIDGAITIDSGVNTDAVIDEDGVDRSSGSDETWNIQNSGAGTMTLQVDGVPVQLTTTAQLTRTAITSTNINAAVTVIRTTGYYVDGDGGGATYKRVVAEPSHNNKVQSADGAWWELVVDPMGISVRQTGAKGDGVTDDGQAFLDAIEGVADLNASGVNVATHRVIVPGSEDYYYMGTTTLELKRDVYIMGAGNGLGSTPSPAMLRWDANVTAIIVHTQHTLGAITLGAQTTAGGGIIEGLHLDSAGGTIAGITDDTKGHGIWLRGRAVIRQCKISNFAGNGIHVYAGSGAGGGQEGNANGWYAVACRITNCHLSGVHVELADVNAGSAYLLDCTGNGRAGIWDKSFLGCTWVAPHASSNGIANMGENGAAESSFVDFGGIMYIAHKDATEADLATTTPGTNDAVWIPVGSGSANVTWQAGQPTGTYFVGGGYLSDTNLSTLIGPYHEPGETPAQWDGFIVGGHFLQNWSDQGFAMKTFEWVGRASWPNTRAFPTNQPSRELTLDFWEEGSEAPIRFVADGDDVLGLKPLNWNEARGCWATRHGGDDFVLYPTDLSAEKFGRANEVTGGSVAFVNGLFVGRGITEARHISNATSAPGSGEHARGEFYFSQNPSVGEPIGWRCTVSGTPGTWEAIYVGDQKFTSAEQTITSGGALTIAHGLGAIPEIVSLRLVCTSAEHNYSVGDEVYVPHMDTSNANQGVSVVPDATNLNVRYGSDANVFIIMDKNTGSSVSITNANWNLVLHARL